MLDPVLAQPPRATLTVPTGSELVIVVGEYDYSHLSHGKDESCTASSISPNDQGDQDPLLLLAHTSPRQFLSNLSWSLEWYDNF